MSGIDKNTILLLKGDDFTDSSFFKYKITNNDATLSNDGKFGKCFNFNGGNFKLEPLDIGTFENGVTVDFWIYRDRANSDANYICGGTYGDFTIGINADINNNTTVFNVFGATTSFTYRIPFSKWMHIAIVCSNGNANLYIDGILTESKNYELLRTTARAMYFGNAGSANNSPYCRVDEFRISNIARWTENFTPPTAPYTYETIDKIPTETNLVESVNSMNEVYEAFDFQRILLANKLKRIEVDILPTDKMSSLISKIGDIEIAKVYSAGTNWIINFKAGYDYISNRVRGSSYTKILEIPCNFKGSIRFDSHAKYGTNWGYLKIELTNNSDIVKSTKEFEISSSSDVTYSYDILNIAVGDKIKIYSKSNNSGDFFFNAMWIRFGIS